MAAIHVQLLNFSSPKTCSCLLLAFAMAMSKSSETWHLIPKMSTLSSWILSKNLKLWQEERYMKVLLLARVCCKKMIISTIVDYFGIFMLIFASNVTYFAWKLTILGYKRPFYYNFRLKLNCFCLKFAFFDWNMLTFAWNLSTFAGNLSVFG